MKGPKSGAVWPAHVPRWLHPALQWWWSGTRWATDHSGAVHLTFDDGPDPDITPWVLDLLEEHGMTATFFAVGAQAKRHPDLLQKARAQGHAVGGHTMNHEHGWHTDTQTYVHSAKASLQADRDGHSLFRPPYGKLTRAQCLALRPHAQIVMWNVLSGDYAARGASGAATVLQRLKRHTRPGSIVVFHDSAKCADILKRVLPEYLTWLQGSGWTSHRLDGHVHAEN